MAMYSFKKKNSYTDYSHRWLLRQQNQRWDLLAWMATACQQTLRQAPCSQKTWAFLSRLFQQGRLRTHGTASHQILETCLICCSAAAESLHLKKIGEQSIKYCRPWRKPEYWVQHGWNGLTLFHGTKYDKNWTTVNSHNQTNNLSVRYVLKWCRKLCLCRCFQKFLQDKFFSILDFKGQNSLLESFLHWFLTSEYQLFYLKKFGLCIDCRLSWSWLVSL